MSLQAELASAHNEQIIKIGDTLASRSVRVWRSRMAVANLDGSWQDAAPQLVAQVASAQVAAAQLAGPYLKAMDRANGFVSPAASVIPEAFSDVMGDGREIGPALYGAVTITKIAIGRGMAPARAFEVGANFIATVVSSALHDLSRSADRSLAGAKTYTRYIRVVNGSACSRCAILAGMYSAEEAFRRHPSCLCGTAPVTITRDGKVPSGFHDSPGAYFDSLSASEQDRVFTQAGAEAIRNGADPVAVVNARRGAYGTGEQRLASGSRMRKTTIGYRPDGTPVEVYATTESTSVKAAWGKAQARFSAQRRLSGARYTSTNRVRLMPEQIFKIAGTDVRLTQAFLRDAGYIDYASAVGYGDGWIEREYALRKADRALVDKATLRYGNFTLG